MAKEIVNDTISVIDDLLIVGSSLFDNVEAKNELCSKIATFMACGELIKVVVTLIIPGKPDPIMERFNELEAKIAQVSDKISSQLEEERAFVSENNLFSDIIRTASTMTKQLQDTMINPSQHSTLCFWDICQKQPSLQYVNNLISLLEQEATNPLKMAMTADKLKTSETFNKWKNIFNNVLSQYLVLECMVSGMFLNKNMHGPNEMAKRIAEFNGRMKEWSSQYKKSYWPETISALIYETQDNYTHVDNGGKANLLEKEIGKILTDDAFYIIVYNDCTTYDEHSFNFNPDKFFSSYGRGKCNVVIYRSLQMNNGQEQTKVDLERMEKEVESCRYNTIPCRTNFEGFPEELMKSRICNAGFVGLIRRGNYPEFRSVNSWREWGPGWWIRVFMSLHEKPGWTDGKYPEFWLIAGYE